MKAVIGNLEVAPPAVVRQAARDFAAALAMSPEFERMEETAAAVQGVAAARKAMLAYCLTTSQSSAL